MIMSKKNGLLLLCVAFMMLISNFVWNNHKGDKGLDVLTIGINQIVDHPALNRSLEGFKYGMERNGFKEGENIKFIFRSAQANPVLALQISNELVSKDVDAIVALGTTSAQTAKKAAESSKTPVFFISITDPIKAGLLENIKKPEGHVTGVSNYVKVIDQLKEFKNILKEDISSIGVIYNSSEDNSVHRVKEISDVYRENNIDVFKVVALKSSEVATATEHLVSKGVSAILIDGDNTALSALSTIIRIGNKHHVPVLATDVDVLSLGVKGAVGADQFMLGEQTADMVVDVIKNNVMIKDLPIQFPEKVISVSND